ncbi:MAG: ABC transporter ATP-binding protein [Fibrobacterota bacterium]
MNKEFRFLYPYIKPHRLKMSAGAMMVALSVFLEMIPVILLKETVDFFRNDSINPYVLQLVSLFSDNTGGPEYLIAISSLVLFFAVLSGIFLFFQRWLIITSSRKIEYRLRENYFDRLLKFPKKFYLKRNTGDLMSVATNDLNRVRDMIGAGTLHVLRTTVSAVFIITAMVLLDKRLSLFAVLPLLIMPVLAVRFLSLIHSAFRRAQEKLGQVNNFLKENFSGIFVIKSYTREEDEERRFDAINKEMLHYNLKLARMRSFFFPLLIFFSGIGLSLLFYFGGKSVIAGDTTLGTLVALSTYFTRLVWPLVGFGWVLTMVRQGIVSTGRFREIMEDPSDMLEGGYRAKLKGEIEFKNFNFKYPGTDIKVLDDINIRIPAGSRAALTGPTGSGKSTLVSCVLRMYEVARGTLFLDGVDIMDYNSDSLRENIASVPQETFLFSDTIENNITYGIEDEDTASVEGSVLFAALDKDIESFPEGEKQVLGEKGVNLSGGQKQRAAIARAHMRGSSSFIFDDSLSAVDSGTEERILDNIKKHGNSKTMLFVSHRISAIMDADIIFVIEDGHITAQGTHEQLINKDGYYKRTYEIQKIERDLNA